MAQETPDTTGQAVPKHFTSGPVVPCPFPTVTAAIRHAVNTHPDAIAAIDLSQAVRREISYAQLETRARCLAQRLRAAGVAPGDRVPLVVKRGIEMLVGIYAILLCGAQYVPLDGGIVPEATLQTVISQSGGGWVVCTGSTKNRFTKADSVAVRGCRLLCMEDDGGEGEAEEFDLATPEGGCYVIYTSGLYKCRRIKDQRADVRPGTTGTPKGVDVTHANVTNLLCTSPGNLGIQPGMKVGQVLNISFDMGTSWSFWPRLGCG